MFESNLPAIDWRADHLWGFVLREDVVQDRFVDAAAAVVVGTAFVREGWHGVLAERSAGFVAERTGISGHVDAHKLDARVFFVVQQRNRAGGKLVQLRFTMNTLRGGVGG